MCRVISNSIKASLSELSRLPKSKQGFTHTHQNNHFGPFLGLLLKGVLSTQRSDNDLKEKDARTPTIKHARKRSTALNKAQVEKKQGLRSLSDSDETIEVRKTVAKLLHTSQKKARIVLEL